MATVYDKSSLFLAPSGVSNGTVFTQKPVPIYGPELVTNGDFATDSDWSKGTGWTISGGTASFNGGADAAISQSSVVTSGTEYKVLFTISDLTTSGSLQLRFGSTGSVDKTITKNGTYYFHLTADGTTLYFRAISGFNGSIDNVSVQEVLTDGADFTFSRGSNLSATRVNEAQLIEKGRENLLKYSEDLTKSQWANIRTTDTSGHTGYDGTANAYKIIPTTDNNTHRLDYVDTWATSQVYTFSFYAKASGYDTIDIVIGGTSIGNAYGRFNLSTGTASNVGASIAASMEDLDSGWYRCQVAQVSGSTTRINIGVNDGTTQSYVGDGTSGVLIQHPQLEQGLVATDYIETTATTGKAGLLENTPRLDYSGGATCPALLLEPQRSNLITQSEYLNGISWNGKIGTSFDTDTTTSPEGLGNSALLKENSSNGSHFAYKDFNLTSGSTYTISIFAKSNGANRNLRFGDGGVGWSSGFNGVFNLTDGTATGGDIESMGDGWYRCSVTGTTNATTSRLIIYSTLGTATSYQGDGTSGVFLYGFQIESGSYPTSYIPNHSGGTITRGADTQSELTIPNGSTTEGTIFYEFDKAQAPNSFDITPLKVGSVKVLSVQQYNPNMRFDINNNAANYNEPNSYNSHIKVAASYVGSVVKLFINGNLRATDNTYSGSGSVVVPENGLQKTQIGCSIESKQLLYFPEALSDTECEILTGATTYETFEEMALALNYTVYE